MGRHNVSHVDLLTFTLASLRRHHEPPKKVTGPFIYILGWCILYSPVVLQNEPTSNRLDYICRVHFIPVNNSAQGYIQVLSRSEGRRTVFMSLFVNS